MAPQFHRLWRHKSLVFLSWCSGSTKLSLYTQTWPCREWKLMRENYWSWRSSATHNENTLTFIKSFYTGCLYTELFVKCTIPFIPTAVKSGGICVSGIPVFFLVMSGSCFMLLVHLSHHLLSRVSLSVGCFPSKNFRSHTPTHKQSSSTQWPPSPGADRPCLCAIFSSGISIIKRQAEMRGMLEKCIPVLKTNRLRKKSVISNHIQIPQDE